MDYPEFGGPILGPFLKYGYAEIMTFGETFYPRKVLDPGVRHPTDKTCGRQIQFSCQSTNKLRLRVPPPRVDPRARGCTAFSHFWQGLADQVVPVEWDLPGINLPPPPPPPPLILFNSPSICH
jgi:hypothetical protein